MANDFEPIADHRVEGFAGVQQLAGEYISASPKCRPSRSSHRECRSSQRSLALRDDKNAGRVREAGGDDDAGRFERTGVNGEREFAADEDGEGSRIARLACSGCGRRVPSCPGSATSGRCGKTKKIIIPANRGVPGALSRYR